MSVSARSDRLPIVALGLVALAAGLRMAAARGDLWLEEIWALDQVHRVDGPWELVTRVHHERKHLLTALWLWGLGDHAGVLARRSLAVLAGTATVALVWSVARRGGRVAALAATALAACSYPLALYGSEVQGIAPVAACAVGAFVLLDAWRRTRRPGALAGFWAVAAAGLAAHASFQIAWTALVLWSVGDAWRARGRPAPALRDLLACQGPPFVVLVVLWALDLRHVTPGLWPAIELGAVARTAVALAFGLPAREVLGSAALAAGAGLAGVGLARQRRRGDDAWIFHGLVLVVAPVLVVLVHRPPTPHFRWLVVCLPFLYVLGGEAAAAAWARPVGRVAATAALAVALGGHLARTRALAAIGRGDSCAVVRWMGEHTAGDVVTVTSAAAVRGRMVLAFHARCLRPGQHLGCVPSFVHPEWMVTHGEEPTHVPPRRIITRTKGRYRMVASFPRAGDSGWSWYVYRSVPPS